MTDWPIRLAWGLLLSLGVALLAYRRGALSGSGVLGAVLTGTLTLGCGGWSWGLALITFFISSSLLTHWRREAKAPVAQAFAKGGARDLGQALANGGVAGVLAILALLWPHPAWGVAFAGALAAATADTWATEIGTLSPQWPRLITTGRPVPPGTSGGITLWGTWAEAAGSLFLGTTFFLFRQIESALQGAPWPSWMVIPLALLGGLAGATADSLLGATCQALYRCPRCGRVTERRRHCGETTVHVRGWPLLNNDLVNFGATLVGAVVAGGLALLLS